MTTYNESNAQLTNALCGRTIDHIVRAGKELEIVCTDGHVVVIQADINGDIHHKKTDVRVMLPPLSAISKVYY